MSQSIAKSNRYSILMENTNQEPDVKDGVDYWATQPASLDGVLGGFGTGSLPRVDALGSRQMLLYLFPELCTVASVIRPLSQPQTKRFRALDVGAGIGRVTRDVLLHLVHDVVLVEPVEKYINEAWARGQYHQDSTSMPTRESEAASLESQDFQIKWKGVQEKTTSVTFIQATHQALNPCHPLTSTKLVGRVGYMPPNDILEDVNSGFDIVWCQWSLGHLSNPDLVSFFRRAKAAFRDEKSVIVVKENICTEVEGDNDGIVFDDQDSSLTRSDRVFKRLFSESGLVLALERVQQGFPTGLFEVKMYALRSGP